jgi:hypothetical protein
VTLGRWADDTADAARRGDDDVDVFDGVDA